MEYLLWSTGRAVLDLVRFADLKVEEGVMKEKRFIFPSLKRIKKWVYSTLQLEDTNIEHTPDDVETGGTGIYVGDSFKAAKDPEHLPPTNSWERFGNIIRAISHQMSSPESAFGFRVACATLTIGILAYLHDTQQFFVRQRLVWAMIMVSIGMTTTAGSGIFGFLGRTAGTGKILYLTLEALAYYRCDIWLTSTSYCHVYKPCDLVHSGRQDRGCHRLSLVLHFCGNILHPQISSLYRHCHFVNGYTDTDHRL